jgi:arsenate reductase
MAEGWVNHELGETWEARSAGTRPAEAVHPLAVQAMAEVGVDISTGLPQLVDAYLAEPWDLVITVCDSARETCPVFPRSVETIHVSFPDPAEAQGDNDRVMAVFRTVRDAIRDGLLSEIRDRTV